MEGLGGLGFSDVTSAVRKKRSNTSRRPRNESQQLPLDYSETLSSTPPSDDATKLSSDENDDYGSITRKRDINLNLGSARSSFSNINEAQSVQITNKCEGGGSGESDEASNDGSFRGGSQHREFDTRRSSKGALAPANWKGATKVGAFGVVSDGSENENKVKKVKLKVGGVTRTIQAKSTSDGASAVGSSAVKSIHISDVPRPRRKLILQGNSDDTHSFISDKGNELRGVPKKASSESLADVGKVGSRVVIPEEPVRKSKRVPKRRFLDADNDGDDNDVEVRYLEKLKASKITSDYNAEYKEDEERETRKERKISTVLKGSGVGEFIVDFGDYGISRTGKDSKKSRVGRVSTDTDYVEEDEYVSDGEPSTKRKSLRKESLESASYNTKEMTVTTRQRALKTGKDVSSSLGASLIEFPNGLPPAPPRKQKEKLCALDQQLKKAEAAEKRRMQVEKATRESEAEAIRKILGQDSSRKKREDKIKKRQEDLAQERAANALVLPSDTVRWVIGPSGSVVTFPTQMGLPTLFDSKPCSYPPPREQCAGPYCTNPYKYRDSQSKLPLCSLQCYKAINT